MSTVTAWPFLIARGRRRGYSVLAAPGFLVRQREEGFLEEVAGPSPDSVSTRLVDSPSGRHLCLVWGDHLVRGDDVGEPADPVDEHSRSLRLLYGFVCQDAVVRAPAPADLPLAAMLATYRRFLRDEEAFVVEESSSFPVEAQVATPPVPVRRPTGMLAGAVVAALLVVLAGVWWLTSRPEPPTEPVVTVVTVGRTVTGTIATDGEKDDYLLDIGEARQVAVERARPRSLAITMRDATTGKRVARGRDGWTVEPNTRYRLTVTSAQGDYTFRIVADDRP